MRETGLCGGCIRALKQRFGFYQEAIAASEPHPAIPLAGQGETRPSTTRGAAKVRFDDLYSENLDDGDCAVSDRAPSVLASGSSMGAGVGQAPREVSKWAQTKRDALRARSHNEPSEIEQVIVDIQPASVEGPPGTGIRSMVRNCLLYTSPSPRDS